MAEEVEEIPPYEEWLVKDLKAELVNRGLNHAGTKAELAERLYIDDEVEEDEIVESGEKPSSDDADEAPIVEHGWVDGNLFYVEFTEDIGRDDFNKLPTTDGHHKMLIDAYHAALNHSKRPVIGGPFDSRLSLKYFSDNKVVYKYCVMLKPE